MGYHYYNYEAYIAEEKSYTLEDIAAALVSFTIIGRTESSLTLSFGGWKLWIDLNNASWVKEESQEKAAYCKKPEIAACHSRLEIYAEDDPEDKHYHDHLYVLEALDGLEGLYIFDPVTGELPYENDPSPASAGDQPEPAASFRPDTGFLEEVTGNEYIEHYIRVLNNHPHLDGIWLNIGTYYEEEGLDELAVRCYETALRINIMNSYAAYNLGTYYKKNKDHALSVKYYKIAMEADPEDGDAPTSLGRMLAADGDLETGIAYMLRGYEAQPDNSYSSMSLGFYYLAAGDPEKALHYADIAISLGDISISSLNKGHALLIRGEEQEAISCYVNSIREFGNTDSFWEDYDSDYELMPQYGISREYYESLKSAINIRRETGQVTTEHLPEPENNTAIGEILRKLRTGNESWEAWFDLGWEYSGTGLEEAAFYCFRVSVLLNDNNEAGQYNVGRHYLEVQKDLTAAEIHLRRAIAIDPELGDAVTMLGELFIARQDIRKGMELLVEAVEKDPDNDYSNCILGYYYLYYGQPGIATQYIEKAMQLGDAYTAVFNRAHVYLAQGDVAQAEDLYLLSLLQSKDEQTFWSDFEDDYKFMSQYGISKESYDSIRERIRRRSLDHYIYLN